MQTIEPKTSLPAWYHYVKVDGPPKGSGTLIAVMDAKGRQLAAAIFGTSEDIGDPGGAIGLFARKPGEAQSWLVRSVVEIRSSPGDWMDKSLISIDRARIQEVEVKPASGASYAVRRDKPSDADFALRDLPSGRELSSPTAADEVATALSSFSFDDVRPASQLDFSNASRLTTKTFDGLTVTANVVQNGQDYWAQLSAVGDPANPESVAEANRISVRASWAYKLPAYKGQQFMTTLESLLKPQGAPARTAE
jgi:hypothetical protein